MAKRKSKNTTAAYTTEFHHEFRAETGRLLRKRFLWFTAALAVFGVVSFVIGIAFLISMQGSATDAAIEARKALSDWRLWASSVVWLALYAGSFLYVFKKSPPDARVLKLSFWLVTVDGLLSVSMSMVDVPGANGIWGFLFTHLLACFFLPWTPFQALKPMAVVLAANALAVLVVEPLRTDTELQTEAVVGVIFSPLLAVPGMLWCLIRNSKRTQDFKLRFMSSRYSEMRRELVDARRIHESLFPDPVETGPLRFAFEYEPMRQIGGDFLFAHQKSDGDADGPLSIVLLDVTGHGIPAALTVNRLHGELERVFAEHPGIGPGEVLGLLNRYVHLTLSTHSIYVTALCLRIDAEESTVEYASGGHPPAFLRAVDGTVEELVSTSFVLGACPDEAFDPSPQTMRFGPGDTVLAYTDGAIEARNETGQMIRIDGIRRMVASAESIPPTKWPRTFRHEVTEFRGGPAEDDTLLLVVHRVVGDRRGKPAGATKPAHASS